MNDTDSIKRMKKLIERYDQGVITESELIRRFLHEVGTLGQDEDVATHFSILPMELHQRLREEIDQYSKMDYYRQWFYIGDTRTPEQAHRDALALQPLNRNACKKLRTF